MLKQKTVYFREEDLELWAAIPNKAEFIHNALHGLEPDFATPRRVLEKLPKNILESRVRPFGTSKNVDWDKAKEFPLSMDELVLRSGAAKKDVTPNSKRFDGPLCKIHGLPLDSRGRCLQKGCKYS